MSALPPKADIGWVCRDVRYVPKADMGTAYSITSSALESNFSCLFARRVAAGESGADDSDSSAASAYKLRRRAPALLVLLCRGAGSISLDALIQRIWARRHDTDLIPNESAFVGTKWTWLSRP